MILINLFLFGCNKSLAIGSSEPNLPSLDVEGKYLVSFLCPHFSCHFMTLLLCSLCLISNST